MESDVRELNFPLVSWNVTALEAVSCGMRSLQRGGAEAYSCLENKKFYTVVM